MFPGMSEVVQHDVRGLHHKRITILDVKNSEFHISETGWISPAHFKGAIKYSRGFSSHNL